MTFHKLPQGISKSFSKGLFSKVFLERHCYFFCFTKEFLEGNSVVAGRRACWRKWFRMFHKPYSSELYFRRAIHGNANLFPSTFPSALSRPLGPSQGRAPGPAPARRGMRRVRRTSAEGGMGHCTFPRSYICSVIILPVYNCHVIGKQL